MAAKTKKRCVGYRCRNEGQPEDKGGSEDFVERVVGESRPFLSSLSWGIFHFYPFCLDNSIVFKALPSPSP